MRVVACFFSVGLAVMGVAGCKDDRSSPAGSAFDRRADPPALAPELSSAFLARAEGALAPYLRPETELLEIRTTGAVFSVQMRMTPNSSDIAQLDYVEFKKAGGMQHRVYGPSVVIVRGKGDLEKNLFAYSSIHLGKMARSFDVARLAVDRDEGEIDRMIVRRFLPFSDRVRARIFVRTPRIPGSIDTNEEGVPLKR